MARALALTAAVAVALLAVPGAGGAATQQTPKRGGTVVVASLTEPACLNYYADACRHDSPVWGDLVAGVLESAYEKGPHAWRPDLTTSASISKRPFRVTYQIRSEARWSDGRPITSFDFVFGSKMLRANPDTGWDPLGVVRTVRALDSRTVQVEFRQRWGRWRNDSSLVALPRHVLAHTSFGEVWKETIDNPQTGDPISSGPFTIARWRRGRQLVLLRNPRYWGAHQAYLGRLVFRFVTSPVDAAAALRRGEVDVVDGVAAAELATVPPRPGIVVGAIPGAGWEHLDFRLGPGGNPALRNKLVRRAIAYGIDRQALVRVVFPGQVANVEPLDSAIFLSTDPSYEPNWSVYRYRPALAHRLLRRAGCRFGATSVYVCEGERLSLRFVTTAGNSRRQQVLEILQRQLGRIGIAVEPEFASGGTLFGTILPQGDFDVALFAWNALSPGWIDSTYRCGIPGNFGGYCSRLVTGDLDQLDLIVDPARRAAVGARVDRRLAQDVPTIPLFQNPYFVAYRSGLHGVVPNPFAGPTWNAENWWLER